jgi:tRNA (cytidine/uridine-2'-O-)-methyltransferase
MAPNKAIRLALYQPDIPQNLGNLLRLAACMEIGVDVIEPCGFPFDDRRLKRAGMDYLDRVSLTRHRSWAAFQEQRQGRLLLLTTAGERAYTAFDFRRGDVLMVGRESAGVPGDIHQAADARLLIPMSPSLRSINVASAAAMVVGEALRQLDGFPQA